jgi:hypothetical protein
MQVSTLFENRGWGEYLDLRGAKQQEDGEDCILRSFITCKPHQYIIKRSNQRGWDEQDMQHMWAIRNAYKVLVRKPEGRDHL